MEASRRELPYREGSSRRSSPWRQEAIISERRRSHRAGLSNSSRDPRPCGRGPTGGSGQESISSQDCPACFLSPAVLEEVRFLINFQMDSASPMAPCLIGQPELLGQGGGHPG